MSNSITQFFYSILEIVSLRKGPQVLPYSSKLMLGLIGTYILIEISHWIKVFEDISPVSLLLYAIIAQSVYVGICYWILKHKKFENRLIKLLIAIYGCKITLTLVASLLKAASLPLAAIGYLAIILFFWELAVEGNCFKQVLEVKMGQAILIVFLVEIFVGAVFLSFTGLPAGLEG